MFLYFQMKITSKVNELIQFLEVLRRQDFGSLLSLVKNALFQ